MEPRGLVFPSLMACSEPQLVHTIFVCDTPIVPITPKLEQGNRLQYSVSPPLPPGLSLDPDSGIISGTPIASAAKADYVVIGQNGKGRALATVCFAACLPWTSVAASDWNSDQVQLWAETSLGLPTASSYFLTPWPTCSGWTRMIGWKRIQRL